MVKKTQAAISAPRITLILIVVLICNQTAGTELLPANDSLAPASSVEEIVDQILGSPPSQLESVVLWPQALAMFPALASHDPYCSHEWNSDPAPELVMLFIKLGVCSQNAPDTIEKVNRILKTSLGTCTAILELARSVNRNRLNSIILDPDFLLDVIGNCHLIRNACWAIGSLAKVRPIAEKDLPFIKDLLCAIEEIDQPGQQYSYLGWLIKIVSDNKLKAEVFLDWQLLQTVLRRRRTSWSTALNCLSTIAEEMSRRPALEPLADLGFLLAMAQAIDTSNAFERLNDMVLETKSRKANPAYWQRVKEMAIASGPAAGALFDRRLIERFSRNQREWNQWLRDLRYWENHLDALLGLCQILSATDKRGAEQEKYQVFRPEVLMTLVGDVLKGRTIYYAKILEAVFIVLMSGNNNYVYKNFRLFLGKPQIDLHIRMAASECYLEHAVLSSLIPGQNMKLEALRRLTGIARASRREMDNVLKTMDSFTGKPRNQAAKLRKKLRQKSLPFGKVCIQAVLGGKLSGLESDFLDATPLYRKIIMLLFITKMSEFNAGIDCSGLLVRLVTNCLVIFCESYQQALERNKSASDRPQRARNEARRAVSKYINNIGSNEINLLLRELYSGGRRTFMESNREIVSGLIQKGVDSRLFLEGVEAAVLIDQPSTKEKQQERISKLMDYAKAADSKNDSECSLRVNRARYIGHKIALQPTAVKVQPAVFMVTVRKDFLEEATNGKFAFTCYHPLWGDSYMPIVHALESNVFSIHVYSPKGTGMGRALVYVDNRGRAFICPAFIDNNSPFACYDLEVAFGTAILRLSQYLPEVYLIPESAGYSFIERLGERISGDIKLSRSATVFFEQASDPAEFSKGVWTQSLRNPIRLRRPSGDFRETDSSI